MILPTIPELNDCVALLLGDGDVPHFGDLSIDQRLRIIEIAQRGILMRGLDELDTRLSVVAEWFEKSRLYEP